MAELKITRNCLYCKSPFTLYPYQVRLYKTGGIYCSRQCLLDASPKLEERFWSKVNIKDMTECWEWKQFCNSDGYGIFTVSKGKQEGAHRVAFKLTYGEINGLKVLHHCDNPSCCNPHHLFLGTDADNVRDKVVKGRQAKGEQCGRSKLTTKDVLCIRELHAKGNITYTAIAKEKKIAIETVRCIVKRITWRHF